MERRHSATMPPPKAAAGASKTNVPKTTSEASLTPSQFAAAEAAKARKNPLDALSRMSLRQKNMEKRSGLQDVDDDFLKGNYFAKTSFNKHSGLNDINSYTIQAHNKPPAGQPSGLTHNLTQSQMNASMQPQVIQPPSDGAQQPQFVAAHHSVPQQPQQMQGQIREQAMSQHAVPMSPATQMGQPNVVQSTQQVQNPPQQLQAQTQQLQQNQQIQQQQQQQLQQQQQQQLQQQQQQATHAANNAQSQQPAAGQHPGSHGNPIQQNNAAQPASNQMAPPQPEPDMCTTCPNCQTTIYLVRPDINDMQVMQNMQGGGNLTN